MFCHRFGYFGKSEIQARNFCCSFSTDATASTCCCDVVSCAAFGTSFVIIASAVMYCGGVVMIIDAVGIEECQNSIESSKIEIVSMRTLTRSIISRTRFTVNDGAIFHFVVFLLGVKQVDETTDDQNAHAQKHADHNDTDSCDVASTHFWFFTFYSVQQRFPSK